MEADKLELVSSSMEYVEEEFYEKIEAPKFVDFTIPTHYTPDDRFWFCSRVGCDQKHEEEMDSEAIYKNFVLRVMAARSPNVRFQRAMARKPLSESKKCPFSAPPKTSKSRLPRLALVSSSISKKLINEENGEPKVPPAKMKLNSTPKARVKHVAAKYMTSPKKKKGSSPKLNGFRSVRNPMKMNSSLPQSKVVAKALVFNSPKKSLKKRNIEEMGTPITKLCERVRKLHIDSQKKGIAQNQPKDCTGERKKLPLDSSRKIPSSFKSKTRETEAKVSKSVKSNKNNNPVWSHQSGVQKSVKSKAKTNSRRTGAVSRIEVENHGDESSDMELDEKSRCGSLEMGAVEMTDRAKDNPSSSHGTSSLNKPITGRCSGGKSSDCQKSETSSGTNATGASNLDEQTRKLDPSSEVGEGLDDKENDSRVQKSEIKACPVEDKASVEENPEETTELNLDAKSHEKGIIGASGVKNQKQKPTSEPKEIEDKENALNFNEIRNLNSENVEKHNASAKSKDKSKQNIEKAAKITKENHPVSTGTQVLRNRKLKTTNPKPFRLRTDERGILKETTLERKVNTTENLSIPNENSQGTRNGVTEKGKRKDEGRSMKKDQLRTIKIKYKTSGEVKPKSEKSSQSNKSPFLQNHAGPDRKHDLQVKSQGHCANEKTKITMSRSKDSRNQKKEADEQINKGSAAQKLAARGNRTGTTPREPKFHNLHKPKNCTRTES